MIWKASYLNVFFHMLMFWTWFLGNRCCRYYWESLRQSWRGHKVTKEKMLLPRAWLVSCSEWVRSPLRCYRLWFTNNRRVKTVKEQGLCTVKPTLTCFTLVWTLTWLFCFRPSLWHGCGPISVCSSLVSCGTTCWQCCPLSATGRSWWSSGPASWTPWLSCWPVTSMAWTSTTFHLTSSLSKKKRNSVAEVCAFACFVVLFRAHINDYLNKQTKKGFHFVWFILCHLLSLAHLHAGLFVNIHEH